MHYDPDTDSAYWVLEERAALESEEIADGIILDFDDEDHIPAIELLNVQTIPQSSFDTLNARLPEHLKKTFQARCQELILTSA